MHTGEIDLQELIHQVKQDLLAPNPRAARSGLYPLLMIEKIELELEVRVTRAENDSIKLTVLESIGVERGSAETRERGHLIRVALTPIVPPTELAAKLMSDPQLSEQIVQEARRALLKGTGGLAGPTE